MPDALQAFEIRTYADNQWHATAHTTVARQAAALASRLAQLGCSKRFVVSSVSEGYSLPLVYLAAWRIEAAVAPIDCEDRDDELADVVKRLDAAVVVCEAKDAERLGRLTPVPVLASLVAGEACDAPPVPFASDAYAHCFFTSGSTGRPKGCLVTRNALATYARARNRVDGVDATSVLLLASHHAFDPTVGDVAQCALSQASLCCAPRQRVLLALDELLRSSRCTHVTTTPPLFNTCVGGRFPDLKVVALGGEALPPKLVEACSGALSLVSVYGVTECCVYQAHRVVKSVGDCGLLGPALVGAISLEDGEVVLRGPLVDGASYLGGESGGHGSDGQGKYYRTGDGGVVEDGAIRLQGRLDDQIKRSGRRTELGALDAALEATALVAACRFVLVDDALVACCAAPAARSATLEADAVLGPVLQAAAGACLKRFVQPAAVLFATELPRTRTDKVDRRACQAAAARGLRDASPQGRRPPNTRVEKAVAFAWREIGVAPPGRDAARDDTFEVLGGDSLLALRACRRLEARLCEGRPFAGDGDDYYGESFSRDAFHPRHCFGKTLAEYAAFLEGNVDRAPPPDAPDPAFVRGDASPWSKLPPKPPPDPFKGDAVLAALDEALGAAAEARRGDALAALLGAARDRGLDLSRTRDKRSTPLARAAAAANADAVAALLAAGAAPTAVDSNARAPLHRCAAAPGGAQCARLLLEASAPIAMRDRAEQSALHFCARSGDAETMKVLAAAGARRGCLDWLDRWGRTPLTWTVLRADAPGAAARDVAAALLALGASPTPVVLKVSVQNRRTTLPPEGPLALATRRFPPDGGLLGGLLRDAAARV